MRPSDRDLMLTANLGLNRVVLLAVLPLPWSRCISCPIKPHEHWTYLDEACGLTWTRHVD